MASFFAYIITFVLVLSLLVFIVLFGPSPRFRDTPIGIANKVLTKDVPFVLDKFDRILTRGYLGRFSRYIISDNTPVVMIAYLFLMGGGMAVFFNTTWKKIPGPGVSSIHWYIVLLVIPTPFIALYIVSKSDPGIITPQNHIAHVDSFPYDHVLFIPHNQCRTCLFSKPARSKHCNACNACVARHDHHCVWISNCVGYSNTHLFIGFLLVNIGVLAYSTYLHYLIFSNQVTNIRRLQRQTIAALGATLQSVKLRSTTQLYWSVVLEAEFSGALFLVSIMITFVTLGFLFHHIWLLSTGTTTNESFKWADIKDAMACGQIVILDKDDTFMYPPTTGKYECTDHRVNRASRIVPLDPPTDEDDVETPAEEACRLGLAAETTRGARTWSQVQNIYSSDSRWENIVDGIRGGKVQPAWSAPRRRWFKRKD